MVISVFPGFKLRILEAHYDYRGLVIRKSDFLSFVNGDAAIASMDILASFMCSRMIGNTMDPHIMTKVGSHLTMTVFLFLGEELTGLYSQGLQSLHSRATIQVGKSGAES